MFKCCGDKTWDDTHTNQSSVDSDTYPIDIYRMREETLNCIFLGYKTYFLFEMNVLCSQGKGENNHDKEQNT